MAGRVLRIELHPRLSKFIATEEELDTIERAIQMLNEVTPKIRDKALPAQSK
jgi:hypothetical protein